MAKGKKHKQGTPKRTIEESAPEAEAAAPELAEKAEAPADAADQAPDALLAAVATAEEAASGDVAATPIGEGAAPADPLLAAVMAAEEAALSELDRAGHVEGEGEGADVLPFTVPTGRVEGEPLAEGDEAAEAGAAPNGEGSADGAPTPTGDEDGLDAVPTALLETVIESLLFVSDRPLGMNDLKRLLHERDTRLIGEALASLQSKRETSGVRVVQTSAGWGLRTNPASAPWVTQILKGRPVRLSRAMLETLAIVAYRQPVTRPEIDDIRGVDCGPVLKTLLDRDLVRVIGKKEDVGRPLLYGTSPEFLRVFSLRELSDLPSLREFHELSAENAARVAAKHGGKSEGSPPAAAADGAPHGEAPPAGEGEGTPTKGMSTEGGAAPGSPPVASAGEAVTIAEAGPVIAPAPINRAPLLGDDGEEEDALLDELDRATAAATRVTEEAQLAAKPAAPDPGAEPQGGSS